MEEDDDLMGDDLGEKHKGSDMALLALNCSSNTLDTPSCLPAMTNLPGCRLCPPVLQGWMRQTLQTRVRAAAAPACCQTLLLQRDYVMPWTHEESHPAQVAVWC